MAKPIYYSPKMILSKRDLNKNFPAIILITGNRSAGKTFNTVKECGLEDFKENGRKFMLVYRNNNELSGCHTIFSDMLEQYPELGSEMTSKSVAGGLFYTLYLDNVCCGYAVSLHNPDKLKKYSAVFKDVYYLMMDEYQTELGRYLPNEVGKLQSLLLTVARGGGHQSREIRCILIGNSISMMNPYFIYWGIYKRVKADTKILRGDGWICEFVDNESAKKSIQESGIYRAFKDDKYMKASTENVYLIDSTIFIEKPRGRFTYLFNFVYEGKKYAVREFYESGCIYVSKKFDPNWPTTLTFKASDHTQNTMMLDHFSYIWKHLRDAFHKGTLRFDELETKNAVFDILAIDIYK